MSTPTSPADVKLPQRSGTVSSGFTRRTSMSDDEAIPHTDSSEVCRDDPLRTEGMAQANYLSLLDNQSPARAPQGLEAHVRISRGLLLCYREGAEVPVQGL
jgi:hypothetical protein